MPSSEQIQLSMKTGEDPEENFAQELSSLKHDLASANVSDQEQGLRSFERISQSGTDQEKKRAFLEILELFEQAYQGNDQLDALEKLLPYFSSDEWEPIIEKYISHYLKLPAEEILRVWKMSHVVEQRASVIVINLMAAKVLEKARPGISETLYREFGIACFARYPEELLIKQFDERDDIERSYGLILNPRADSNGAFYTDRELWSKLLDDLEGKVCLRVAESSGGVALPMTLARVYSHYRPSSKVGHKIGFLIGGGHGTVSNVTLDERPEVRDISRSGLVAGNYKRIGEYFEKDAVIILNSCLTGNENGIAQVLSEEYGFHVIGATVPTQIKTLTVSWKEGDHVQIEPTYADDTDDERVLRAYKDGQVTATL